MDINNASAKSEPSPLLRPPSMPNPSIMGPPLSPRETRRSGRRSAQSASGSGSKSPDSQNSESATHRASRETSAHRPLHNSNGRSKRLKQEELDDAVGDEAATGGGTPTTTRGKRKTKEKMSDLVVDEKHAGDRTGLDATAGEGVEEEPSVTRCVCGSTVDEEGEFMVQCETCDVWQHGLCVGYEDEGQVANIDYYCEQCRPDLHQDLLKQLAKKARQSSATSHHNHKDSVSSRLSRSHSPSHLLKPAKRRNTMNSRDAAFDESIKEIIEATAAEAAGYDLGSVGNGHEGLEEGEVGLGGRKKRKRTEDDAQPKKRTRSASSASDHVNIPNIPREGDPPTAKSLSASAPVSKGPGGRKQRGGRKPAAAVPEAIVSVDGEEAARPAKPRGKPGPAPKRPPPVSGTGSATASHEHGTRRNANGVNSFTAVGSAVGGATGTTSAAEASRAYRNSHAYAVSQQPFHTSWGLPDYLQHLEHMLPTNTPQPLEVRASGAGGRESIERGLERGAKVKWPSKRMSVGDMNKRVRALVEWVGREQAGAMNRSRRNEALDKALRENAATAAEDAMAMDATHGVSSSDTADFSGNGPASTLKQMEELMEELIMFQERFGPGAKIANDRGRRIASG